MKIMRNNQKKLITQKLIFPKKTGRFCFLTNVTNYLNHYGHNFSENEIACMLAYWGFSFKEGDCEVVCGRHEGIAEMFLTFVSVFNLIKITFNIQDKNIFLKSIQDKLNQNIVSFFWFDTYNLEYSPYYKKTHHITVIILLKINANEVLFFDNGLRILKLDNFLNVLNQQKLFDSFIINKSSFFSKLVLMKNGIQQMSMNFQTKQSHLGLKGMQNFYKIFKTYKNPNKFYHVYYQLNRPGGLTISRQMLYELLLNFRVNKIFNIDDKLLDVYKKLVTQWRYIANLSFKLSFKYSSTLHHSVIDRLEKVICDENKGMNKLQSAIDDN